MLINNPEITVLMPVYNDERFVRFSVESILNQTFHNFEFLIINDASNDSTLKILKEYQDPRIIIVNNEVNLRLTKTLNKGLNFAKGKYIARIDSDDISVKERLEKQYLFLKNNKEFGLVGSYSEVIGEDGENIAFWHEYLEPEYIFYTLSFWNCLVHSSVMFEKELAIKLGGYSTDFDGTEDYELWYKISRVKKIYIIPEYLSKYRKNKYGISAKNSEEQLLNAENVVITKTEISKELLDYLKSMKKPNSFIKKISLINQLYKINKKIENEGLKINLSKKRLNEIANQRLWNFIKRDLINFRLKNFLKKLIKKSDG